MQNATDDILDFTIVDNHSTPNGDIVTEFKDCDGKILIKHFSGVNSENFVVKKLNGKQMQFAFVKLHGVYYININGHHIVDYRKFRHIQSISNNGNDVKINNLYIGEIVLLNCDTEIVYKALNVMHKWMKMKSWWLEDLLYYVFN
jgi:hypothetical protein